MAVVLVNGDGNMLWVAEPRADEMAMADKRMVRNAVLYMSP
jgi:hypothetical protein